MTSIEQLLDKLDNSRESLLMAIEPLPDEALLEKQAIGEWSIGQVLNNITAWEAELVTGMMRLQQNKRPNRLLEALRDPTKFDKQRYAEYQDRDLDQIFLDLQQALDEGGEIGFGSQLVSARDLAQTVGRALFFELLAEFFEQGDDDVRIGIAQGRREPIRAHGPVTDEQERVQRPARLVTHGSPPRRPRLLHGRRGRTSGRREAPRSLPLSVATGG